ncbi:MAG: hypothetical protein U1E97_01735 [Alphaproteobacteria bacterium]
MADFPPCAFDLIVVICRARCRLSGRADPDIASMIAQMLEKSRGNARPSIHAIRSHMQDGDWKWKKPATGQRGGMNGRTFAVAFIEGLPKPQPEKEEKQSEIRDTNKVA